MKKKNSHIYILTGNVHTGKTTILKSVCSQLKQKGIHLSGLLSLSLYSGDTLHGYNGYDLATNDRFTLARVKTGSGDLRCGRFVFSPEGQKRARAALLRPGRFDLTVVDEIGPLELKRLGFWQPVTALLSRGRSLLIVIRKPLLPEFTKILPLPDVIFDISRTDLQKRIVDTILKEKAPNLTD